MHPDMNRLSNLTIGVLGQIVVVRNGERCELPASRKVRGLLAYLALTQRPCSRVDLCDLLWEGTADPKSELRWALAKLRRVVGPWLDASCGAVALGPESLSVDALLLRDIALNMHAEHSVADALALYRGQPLADVEVRGQPAFQAWAAAERDALARIRTSLLKSAVDLAWEHPEEALSAARRLVAAEPWNDWGHARVVQLLRRCGRVDEAVAYATATRNSLSQELGIAEAQLVTNPPPPVPSPAVAIVVNDRKELLRDKRIPTVRLERLKLAPRCEDSAALALRVTAGLNTGLWDRNSCIVLDGDRAAHHQIGKADPGFAVRGAIARASSSAQVSLRCVDVCGGSVVWSGQIELEVSSTADLQRWVERAVESMCIAMQSADDTHELQVSLATAGALAASLEPRANELALSLLDEILKKHSDEPKALAQAAWCYAQRVVYNWSRNSHADRAEARYYAELATCLGINSPNCLTTIATARMLVGDPNGAEVLLKRSLQLDKHAPEARVRSGWLANFAEDPREASRHFRAAINLAPLDPASFNALAGLGVAHFIEGDYAQATRRMEQALALNPKAVWIYRNLIPAYAAARDVKKAEAGVRVLLDAYPGLTVTGVTDAIIFSSPVMAKIAEGLRQAGLPR